MKATLCGLGISVQPCVLADAHPDLVCVLPHAPLPGHDVWLTYHRDLRHILRVRVTADFLVDFLGT